MIVVFQYFRTAGATATHPGSILNNIYGSDVVAERRKEMQEVVDFAMETLRSHSPVGSGRDPHPGLYRDSHTLFVNGNDVKDLASWKTGDEIEISNPVPYARVIEVGDGKFRVPHNVYDLASEAVANKYYEIAKIGMTYMPVRFGAVEQWAKLRGTFGSRQRFSTRRGMEWLARQPALIIKGLD